MVARNHQVRGVNRDVASVAISRSPTILGSHHMGKAPHLGRTSTRRVCHRGRYRLADTFEGIHQRNHRRSRRSHDDEQTGAKLRTRLKDVLLGPAQLYEALRERAGQQLEP